MRCGPKTVSDNDCTNVSLDKTATMIQVLVCVRLPNYDTYEDESLQIISKHVADAEYATLWLYADYDVELSNLCTVCMTSELLRAKTS